MIVCAGKNETLPFAHPIGVGLIESAMNLTQLALFDKPEFLLFVGSAGSYGEHKIFDIVQSRGATQLELSFFEGNSYTPLDNALVSEGLEINHDGMINSSNYITASKKFWPAFVKNGIVAENMEFFSILQVAKEHNIPCGGIFVITNYCDENAHTTYMQNYKKGLELLYEFIKERYNL
ncbi:purine-nucleoside phosphorylase [Nitratiruptor sp. YY09-18]|uniref:5'-methylthioadenosine/S-adenosylhomocysteine nucleosidase family protein n=1 Tax=Nitratiruptor sp. YY09-18 TaxID=2724901 RepID=UPI001915C6D1|nr:purine-nucleoside phosphorylase [Nitratiruptor sp. YY09-18]BCD67192.1 hypothetical protein NitYY0918_C0062 [Nitratiruptor sp. YY09-18]